MARGNKGNSKTHNSKESNSKIKETKENSKDKKDENAQSTQVAKEKLTEENKQKEKQIENAKQGLRGSSDKTVEKEGTSTELPNNSAQDDELNYSQESRRSKSKSRSRSRSRSRPKDLHFERINNSDDEHVDGSKRQNPKFVQERMDLNNSGEVAESKKVKRKIKVEKTKEKIQTQVKGDGN